jgi:NAD(P)-dependent dehydrogenase (short-subunit alcohol dehydrogenase family)
VPRETRPYCLVTGGAGGIGQALVRAFSQQGYAVIATDLGPQPDGLPCMHYLQADLARLVNEESYADEVFASFRRWLPPHGLKALINNAAVQILGGVDTLSRQDWTQTLNVNLLAPFLFAQALLPALERAGGSIINISSIHARLTKKGFVAYATSKAALSGMTKAMAVDLQDRVRINAIEPAAIETEMLKAGFDGKPELHSKLKSCHPLQRIGSPAEVASLALMLVNSNIGFAHGACIGLDGGISGKLMDPD